MAASEAACKAIWLRRLLEELGYEQRELMNLNIDNRGAKELAENPEHHQRTKHIDVAGDANPADIFTKPLGSSKFADYRVKLGIWSMAWE